MQSATRSGGAACPQEEAFMFWALAFNQHSAALATEGRSRSSTDKTRHREEPAQHHKHLKSDEGVQAAAGASVTVGTEDRAQHSKQASSYPQEVLADCATGRRQKSNEEEEEEQEQQHQERVMVPMESSQPRRTLEESAPAEASADRPEEGLRDIMPLLEALLGGHLGPVALDVHILGSISLVQDPSTFEQTLLAHEHANAEPLKVLASSIKPYFLVAGSGLYTLDTEVYPVLPLLTQLLLAPRVRKVLLHAQLFYRLLFLFLGTDRVGVANVVDLAVWTSTMCRVCVGVGLSVIGVMQVSCTADAHAALNEYTQKIIEARAVSLKRWLEEKQPAKDGGEEEAGSVSGGEGASSSSSTATSLSSCEDSAEDESETEGPTEGGPSDSADADGVAADGEEDAALFSRVVAATKAARRHRHRRHGHAHKRSREEEEEEERKRTSTLNSQTLSAVYKGLGTNFSFYEQCLKPLEERAVTATTTISTVCERRTYVEFLCALMTYHGMFVDKTTFDAMYSNIEEQITYATRQADAIVSGRRGGNQEGQAVVTSVRTAAEDAMVQLLSDIAVGEEKSLVVLGLHAVDTAGAAAAQHPWRKLNGPERCIEALSAAVHTRRVGASAQQLISLCRLWLAIQERAAFLRTLKGMFKTEGVSMQARVLPLATEASDEGESADATAGGVLCFSVHPTWIVHSNTTGRIFCARPNLQTVPKKPPRAKYEVPTADEASETTEGVAGVKTELVECESVLMPGCMFRGNPNWNLRDLYVAPPGCVLLSLDYNQIELRVVAHLSQDAALIEQLSKGGDVLADMTRAILFPGNATAPITAAQRQAVKVVVYGLIYGMGPERMQVDLANLREDLPPSPDAPAPPLSATRVIDAFYRCFPNVRSFLKDTRQCALFDSTVRTITGKKDLSDVRDPNRRKQASVAVAVQGSAADILHASMEAVHKRRHTFIPYFPVMPLALVMAAHDELVYVVPVGAVDAVAPQVRAILQDQASAFGMRVPLPVSMRVGPSLGKLEKMS